MDKKKALTRKQCIKVWQVRLSDLKGSDKTEIEGVRKLYQSGKHFQWDDTKIELHIKTMIQSIKDRPDDFFL
jgi:hypothetical protein